MKSIFSLLCILSILGCHNSYQSIKQDGPGVDTLIISDTLLPDIIIIRDTITPDTVRITDTVLTMPLNPWPGMIISMDNFHGDSLKRVWVQWGENGPWHSYLLNDTTR